MKYILLQIIGMIMMAVGATIFIKSLFHPEHKNMLMHISDNFWTREVVCACIAIIGILLTKWAAGKRERNH